MNWQRNILYFSIILLSFGLLYAVFQNKDRQFEKQCIHAEKQIAHFSKTLADITNQEGFIKAIKNNDFSLLDINKWNQNDISLFVYKDKEIFFWTDNAIAGLNPTSISTQPKVVTLKNGIYITQKTIVGEYEFIGAQLIKHEYAIVNKYLKNHYSVHYPFDHEATLSYEPKEQATAIKAPNGDVLFYIEAAILQTSFNPLSIFINVLTFIAFWIITFILIRVLRNSFGDFVGFITLAIAYLLFLELLFFFDFEIKKTILFSPELYATQYFGKSLGHLIIYSIGILLLSIYATLILKKRTNKLITFCFGIYSALLLLLFHGVVKSLILDSVISFEINNFTLTNIYTFFGLNVMLILWTAFAIPFYSFIKRLAIYALKNRILFLSVFFLVVSILLFSFDFDIAWFWSIFIIAFGLLLYSFISFFVNKNLTFYTYFFSLIISTFILSYLINYYNLINDNNQKESIAYELSENRDLITEYRFNLAQQEIQNDPYFKKFFVSPFVSSKELEQRLNYIYFTGYLSKYNIQSYTFNLEGKLMRSADTLSLSHFEQLKSNGSQSGFCESLYLIPQQQDNNYYLSIIPIKNNDIISGTLVIELLPKAYHKENIYPELLVEQKTNAVAKYKQEKEYDYAIYKHNYLISQTGEFPFPYFFGVFEKEQAIEFPFVTNKDAFKLHFFETDEETKVIISNPKNSILISLSTFSYIFCFIFLWISLIYFSYQFFKRIRNKKDKLSFQLSFKNKINIAIIGITLASFLTIVLITISFFTNQFTENNNDNLIKKQKSVLSALEYIIDNQNSDDINALINVMNNEVASLAEIQSIDINIFNLKGQLVVSSQPGVFGKGLISKNIHPNAFIELNQIGTERYTQQEHIGDLTYQSVYVPIRLKNGKAVAILNLPYFAQEETLRKEVSNLMVALVNVYLLLLLASILIALIISNSITSPLASIRKKLTTINLAKKNEAIEWTSNDEIGALVREYNTMLLQLEKSASSLAKSERESAWREMARQIAHEIKNPLTPMKLSIQHLQRTLNDDDKEKTADLTKKVCVTLVEQIDNLSEIANAFSSFAKMPTANKEKIDLVDIIQNVVELFDNTNNATISFDCQLNQADVFADKNQLISVFNNLIKNAIQATEDIEHAKIDIGIDNNDNQYLIRITDNGVGIPDDKKDKVFVPNFTTKSSGTGLGLAISKQIVRNSQGEIWFESIENHSTTFFVSLPKYTEQDV